MGRGEKGVLEKGENSFKAISAGEETRLLPSFPRSSFDQYAGTSVECVRLAMRNKKEGGERVEKRKRAMQTFSVEDEGEMGR